MNLLGATAEAAKTPSPSYQDTLDAYGIAPVERRAVRTVQVNVGKLCNQACHHCHVDAGPRRREIMSRRTAQRVIEVLTRSNFVETVDLTGGAPELNPSFPLLVEEVRKLGLRVIDRCNLTVLFENGMDWLAQFLRANEVELICSMPCYTAANVDQQRGQGVFRRSIEGLRLLNSLGYGRADSPLQLSLVYNPLGPSLPPPQAALEESYRAELGRSFGIEFHRLLTITNMPIHRFADQLHRQGRYEAYMSLLVNHFNPATIDALMCRTMVSVGWQGSLYDCDFNQMLEIPLEAKLKAQTIHSIHSFDELAGTQVACGQHCFGCSAGAGSSCTGALEG